MSEIRLSINASFLWTNYLWLGTGDGGIRVWQAPRLAKNHEEKKVLEGVGNKLLLVGGRHGCESCDTESKRRETMRQ